MKCYSSPARCEAACMGREGKEIYGDSLGNLAFPILYSNLGEVITRFLNKERLVSKAQLNQSPKSHH